MSRGYYYDAIKKRYDWGESDRTTPELKVDGVEGLESTPAVESVPTADKGSSNVDAALAAGQTASQGGNILDTAGMGLMMSKNPKAMAAGLALQTISGINKSAQQREQNRYLAELQRVKARQDAIDKMAQIGQGLRA